MYIKRGVLFLFLVLSWVFVTTTFAADIGDEQLKRLIQTIQELKHKVETLEEKLKAYEEKQKEIAKEQKELKEAKETLEALKEALGNVKISADITLVGQGSVNNDDNNKYEGDVQDAAWSFDLEIESKLGEGATAYMLIEGGQGEGVEDEVPTFSGFNDDAPGTESAHMEVTEAWFEQELKVSFGKFTFTLGKVDLTNYFDTSDVANDETAQFLSSGFVNNLAVEWPDDNGLGARITFEPTDVFYVSLGWAEADGDWEDIFDDGFGIVEVGFHTKFGGLDGNYRFYAWVNAKDHLDVDDLEDVAKGKKEISSVDDDKTNWGVGFSFDQAITEGVVVFARGGVMDSDVVSGELEDDAISVDSVPVKGALSFGFGVSGKYWGRENDEFGIAFGVVFIDDEAEEFYRDTGLTDYYDYYRKPEKIDMANEYHLETYYRMSLFDGKLEFSPDFQVVWNPNGIDDADTVYVFGTRMQVNF